MRFFLAGLCLFAALTGTHAQPPIAGGARDAHGCIGSAGYEYSTLRERCIRVFVDGVRLDPVATTADEVVSAFAVFPAPPAPDRVEIFPPSGHSAMLTRQAQSGEGVWLGAEWKLILANGRLELQDAGGKALFSGAAPPR